MKVERKNCPVLVSEYRAVPLSWVFCHCRSMFVFPSYSHTKIASSTCRILYSSPLRDIVYVSVIVDSFGGMYMAVSYKRLFHLLIERDMTAAQLQQQAGFSANITTRMKRNGYLSLDTIQ